MKIYRILSAAIAGALLLSGCRSAATDSVSVTSVSETPQSATPENAPPESVYNTPAPSASPQVSSSEEISFIELPEPTKAFDRIVLVGDSRVYQLGVDVLGLSPDDDLPQLFGETEDGDYFIGAIGKGVQWLYDHTEEIEAHITDNCALIVNMGVNGAPDYHSAIADWCSSAAEKFADRGVKVFFMSVNPINNELGDEYGYLTNNDDVIAFNEAIRGELVNVEYIDTYSFIYDDICGPEKATIDGIHYYEYVYQKIMDYTWKKVLWQTDISAS